MFKFYKKLRQRTQTIKELDEILDLNFQTFGKHPDASRYARGLGAIYLRDGELKNDDLKLLYEYYVSDSLSGGQIEEYKDKKSISLTKMIFIYIDLAAMNQLGSIFGLCEKESKAIIAKSAYELSDKSISVCHTDVGARLADFYYTMLKELSKFMKEVEYSAGG
ncbi:hypothetical protein POM88_036136 [Heracleum sosnowskyi]|uniref:Uncharacterized protein n=1 Tax=Heracleum sosnowskyi TaxID=360622 RepID=A0AAD8HMS9_9APIA|nr:hypothetical protein POM88_036136 [Heracleum sosnowskyi]